MKHKVEVIPKEEILANRSNAYEFIDFDKKEETKQDEIDFIANELAIEKEMFELEQELDIPSHLRWHNSKPKQEGYICPQTLLQCDDECCVSAEDCHIKEWTYLSEPKQETLEEVAENYAEKWNDLENQFKLSSCFIAGAKWQQEKSYSEEEVLELLLTSKIEKHEDIKEWFEKFKKP
jgi:hypothetical protein